MHRNKYFLLLFTASEIFSLRVTPLPHPTIPLRDFVSMPHSPTPFGNVLANVAWSSEEWLHALGQSVEAVELYEDHQRPEYLGNGFLIPQWFPRQSIASKAIGHVLKRHRVLQLFCPRAVQYVETLKPRRSRRLSHALNLKLHWLCRQQRKIGIRRQGIRTQQLRALLSFSLAGLGPSHDPILSLNWLHLPLLPHEQCNLTMSIPTLATVMNLCFLTSVPHLLHTTEERILTHLTRRHFSPFALAIALSASKATAGAELFWKRQAFIPDCNTSLADSEDEYRYDIIRYMHDMESITIIPSDIMIDRHLDSDWEGYYELIDLIVEIHHGLQLRSESLFLAVNILNRYLSRRECPYHNLRLAACTSLWIASKVEDVRYFRVSTLVNRCWQDRYKASSFIDMETAILSTLDWTLSHPTATTWLRLLHNNAPEEEDERVIDFARLLAEITLFYREFLPFPPSSIALASFNLARHLCGVPPHILEETDECREIIELLDYRLSQYSDPLPRSCYSPLFRLPPSLDDKYSCAYRSFAASAVVVAHRQRKCFVHQRVSPLWTLVARLSRLQSTAQILGSKT